MSAFFFSTVRFNITSICLYCLDRAESFSGHTLHSQSLLSEHEQSGAS